MKKILDNIFGRFEFQRALRLAISFLAFFYASFSLYAAEDTRFWENIGPEGARIENFITSQDHPEIVYAFFQRRGSTLYSKSSNSGKSWVTLPSVKEFNYMSGLAVDSINPHILFAQDRWSGILLKSTDNAMHWQQLGGDLSINASSFFPLNPYVTQSLRVLINTDDTYKEFGMAISQDGGQQWSVTDARVHLGVEEEYKLIEIEASDPKNSKILYGVYNECGFVDCHPKALYKSIDEGFSWISIIVPGKYYSGNFIIAPDNSEKLYATFSSSRGVKEVMVSNNGGTDWEYLGRPVKNEVEFKAARVYIDPTDSRILYANLSANLSPFNGDYFDSYKSSIAKSYNSGGSWQVIDTFYYFPSTIVINAQNNQKLLMAYEGGVLRSENGGINWVPSNSGLNGIDGTLSVAENDDTTVMYLAAYWGGYYKSTNGGQYWQAFQTSDPVTLKCRKFLINTVDNQEIICQTSSGFFRSKDAGKSWETFNSWETFKVSSHDNTAVYANDGKTIYIYSHFGVESAIIRSTDSGLSWSKTTNIISESGNEVFTFSGLPIVDPRDPNIIYATAYLRGATNYLRGLFKSRDGGDSWQPLIIRGIDGYLRLIMHPQDPDKLIFSVGQKRYWLSENGGDSWVETLRRWAQSNDNSTSEIEFDPDNLEGLFWAGNGGVYHSADKGATWDKVNKGLEGGAGSLITTSKNVFVSSQGIFKLTEKTDFFDFSEISDCLFQWAEHEYPDLFGSESSESQLWGGYLYRYYKKSNIYLGFFHEQEVHLNWANVSNYIDDVDVVGSVEFYQDLADCH